MQDLARPEHLSLPELSNLSQGFVSMSRRTSVWDKTFSTGSSEEIRSGYGGFSLREDKMVFSTAPENL